MHRTLDNVHDLHEVTALFHAVCNNHPAVVKALLEAGARTDFTDSYGSTPLKRALCGREEESIAQLLREYGAEK